MEQVLVRITNRRQWWKQKKIRKQIQRGTRTILNLSHSHLSNVEYRILGKTSNEYSPKAKIQDQIQLKQDVFEFKRKLRLREYFDVKASDEYDSEEDTCDNNFEYVKRNTDPKATFVPPSNRDTKR